MTAFEEMNKLLSEYSPDWEKIKDVLNKNTFTQEELARLGIEATDRCFCEYRDALDPDVSEISLERLWSRNLFQTISLLLDYGMNPNMKIDDDNVMWNTQWVDTPDVGASTLRLLLEHGGDPNLKDDGGETLFEYIGFKVSYDSYGKEDKHVVQCWLVLMAYGGCWDDGGIPLEMLNGNEVNIFRNFELFDYTIEPLPEIPGYYGNWIMHIFNIKTGEEVARYR